jgi:hypothetical protein
VVNRRIINVAHPPHDPLKIIMKFNTKLISLSSIAALVVSSHVLGDELEIVSCAEFVTPEIPLCEMEVVPFLGELPVLMSGEDLTTDEVVTDLEVTKDLTDPVLVDDTTVVEEIELTGFPIDWVKRGEGGSPEEIYQTLSSGPAPAPEVATGEAMVRNTEQDEQSSVILTQAQVESPQIERTQKGPVALVNEGRVFLR